jgi:hypothetical protein
MFNQTGAGEFCIKETGKNTLEEGFKAAGYSGLDDERINGLMATVQIIQLGHSGSALYNVSNLPSLFLQSQAPCCPGGAKVHLLNIA